MATPGLPPVVGTTPLRVTDAHAREDTRHSRHRQPAARGRTATEDAPPHEGGDADSYTHEDGGSNREQDKAEEVRRLLERALASAERQLRGDTSREDAPLAALTATAVTVEPSPRDANTLARGTTRDSANLPGADSIRPDASRGSVDVPNAGRAGNLPESSSRVIATLPLDLTSVVARYRVGEDDARQPPHSLDTVG